MNPLEALQVQFMGSEAYFKKHGFSVEYGSRDELIPCATNDVGCGDDRNENHGPAIFGSLWQVIAAKTGGDPDGIWEAIDLARRAGVQLTYHDHCGFFDKWTKGEIKTPFSLKTDPKNLEIFLEFVAHEEYPGEHQSHVLTLNSVPGYTTRPNGTYRTDLWVAKLLHIPDFRAIDIAAQTAKLLGVDTVRIIK